jgi:purine-binding chemotaxis protein CheW
MVFTSPFQQTIVQLHRSIVDTVLQLVVFTLQDQLYALRVSVVERIFRVAEVTALPKAPAIVSGVINVQGRVIPVVSLRQRFGLAERGIELADRLIIARTARRVVALLVDSVQDVVDCMQSDVIDGERILQNAQYVEGVLKTSDGLIVIHDLDTLLSPLEDEQLARALAPA